MNPQHERHEPLDPEERALARLLADSELAEPSAGLDARILAAARASSRPAQVSAPRRRRLRWPATLGLAASVTLAVGVAWQLREPPLPAPAPVRNEVSIQPPEAENAASRPATAPVAEMAPPPAPMTEPSTRQAPPEQQRVAVAAARERTDQRQEKAARQAETRAAAEAEQARAQQAAVAAASQRTSQRAEKAARQMAAAPSAALPPPLAAPPVDVAEPRPTDVYQEPSPPAPPAPVADMGAAAGTIPAERARAASADDGFAADPPQAVAADAAGLSLATATAMIDADARLPATQWLQRIRERVGRGEQELARASMARFVAAHPDVPLPDDLRLLAP
ncbi:hypothetical protein [Pseudoxanthomonas daejeonensis]